MWLHGRGLWKASSWFPPDFAPWTLFLLMILFCVLSINCTCEYNYFSVPRILLANYWTWSCLGGHLVWWSLLGRLNYQVNHYLYFFFFFITSTYKGFPGGSVGKESACSAGDQGLISGLGRSSGAGNSNLLLYSCLEIPWAEEPGGLQSMGSQRVGHNWATKPSPLLLCWPLGWSWEYNSSRESPQMRCYKNGDVVKGKGLMSQEGWGGCSWGIATYSIHTLPCPKQFYYRETVSLVWKKLQLKPFSVILGGSEELLYHSPLSISVEKNSWTAKW